MDLLNSPKELSVNQSGGLCFFTEPHFTVTLLVRDGFSIARVANLKDKKKAKQKRARLTFLQNQFLLFY